MPHLWQLVVATATKLCTGHAVRMQTAGRSAAKKVPNPNNGEPPRLNRRMCISVVVGPQPKGENVINLDLTEDPRDSAALEPQRSSSEGCPKEGADIPIPAGSFFLSQFSRPCLHHDCSGKERCAAEWTVGRCIQAMHSSGAPAREPSGRQKPCAGIGCPFQTEASFTGKEELGEFFTTRTVWPKYRRQR